MRNFKVLISKSVDELADDVTIALNDNWELSGPIFVTMSTFDGKPKFHQAIIKSEMNRPTLLNEEIGRGVIN